MVIMARIGCRESFTHCLVFNESRNTLRSIPSDSQVGVYTLSVMTAAEELRSNLRLPAKCLVRSRTDSDKSVSPPSRSPRHTPSGNVPFIIHL